MGKLEIVNEMKQKHSNMKQEKWKTLDKLKDHYIVQLFLKMAAIKTHLKLWKKKNTWVFVFFKNFRDNSNVPLDFKKYLQVFPLNCNFRNIEFYAFN